MFEIFKTIILYLFLSENKPKKIESEKIKEENICTCHFHKSNLVMCLKCFKELEGTRYY